MSERDPAAHVLSALDDYLDAREAVLAVGRVEGGVATETLNKFAVARYGAGRALEAALRELATRTPVSVKLALPDADPDGIARAFVSTLLDRTLEAAARIAVACGVDPQFAQAVVHRYEAEVENCRFKGETPPTIDVFVRSLRPISPNWFKP